MLHEYPSIKRGWDHERLGFPASVKTDKVKWVLVSQPTVAASEGKPKACKVDNLGGYSKGGTDPGPVNPVFPWVFFLSFNMELRKKEISCETGW